MGKDYATMVTIRDEIIKRQKDQIKELEEFVADIGIKHEKMEAKLAKQAKQIQAHVKARQELEIENGRVQRDFENIRDLLRTAEDKLARVKELHNRLSDTTGNSDDFHELNDILSDTKEVE